MAQPDGSLKVHMRPKLESCLELFKNDQYKSVKSQSEFDDFIKNFKSKLKV